MLYGAATDYTSHRHVIGRIEKRHISLSTIEQVPEIAGASRIATQQAVFTELPQIAKLRDRWTIEAVVIYLVSGIV